MHFEINLTCYQSKINGNDNGNREQKKHIHKSVTKLVYCIKRSYDCIALVKLHQLLCKSAQFICLNQCQFWSEYLMK